MAIPALLQLSIRDLALKVQSGEVPSVELTEACLGWIERENPALNAFITVRGGEALREAKARDRELRRGRPIGPLHGIPIAVKDNIYVKGTRCTMGSRVMAGFIPDHDAASVVRLRQAGAVILGKTNTHEFASGVTSVNPHYGPVRNPWNPKRISGGSSGGSAAAVSSCMCPGALGTETTGSIRIPASLCGVVGMKPTLGRISTYGTFPLARTMDCVGVIARTTLDAAVLLRAIASSDPRDPATSGSAPVSDYPREASRSARGTKVMIPREYFLDLLDQDVRRLFWSFIDTLASIGLEREEFGFPRASRVQEVWRPIRYAEPAAVHHYLFPARRDEYGKDVAKMLDEGLKVSAADYIRALEARTEMLRDLVSSMRKKNARVLAFPTTAVPAPSIEAKTVEVGGETMDVYLALGRLTLATSVLGLPGVTVPVGFTREGLPVGAQVAGLPFEEGLVLRVAHAFESARDGSSSSFIPNLP
jgi:aspartyl-tRNA(Asn)/glutamyl-tRNA(Gln) amidotransferase subunit A